MLSVIIPTLKFSSGLAELLLQIEDFAGEITGEIIISYADDGLAINEKSDIFGPFRQDKIRLVKSDKGRGRQLGAGADNAQGDFLLFLHSDSRLGENWQNAVKNHIQNHSDKAGYFALAFDANGLRPRALEFWVWLRCKIFALPYGDQGLLISKDLYQQIGGYANISLFEDVDIITRLSRRNLRKMPAKIITSPVRYEQEGYLRRGIYNLRLLFAYLRGASPEDLAARY